MSDTTSEYMVERFGGTEQPNDEALVEWLNDRAAEGWTLVTVDGGVGYLVRMLTAPSNVDVPHVSQTGDALNCTMGNWTHDPTSYSYQWRIDGTDAGTDSPVYDVKAGDVGKTATCTVTASNAAGSGIAPPSDEVVVT